jgi:hypothetical protein
MLTNMLYTRSFKWIYLIITVIPTAVSKSIGDEMDVKLMSMLDLLLDFLALSI